MFTRRTKPQRLRSLSTGSPQVVPAGWICGLVTRLVIPEINFQHTMHFPPTVHNRHVCRIKILLRLVIFLLLIRALSLTSSKITLSLINTSGMSHFLNIAWLLKTSKGSEILSVLANPSVRSIFQVNVCFVSGENLYIKIIHLQRFRNDIPFNFRKNFPQVFP